jgi:membrane-associated phospholipid phosphatase
MSETNVEGARRPSFYTRWLSAEGYLGLHLVIGFALALATFLLFQNIADEVFETQAVLAADARAQAIARTIASPLLTELMKWASLVGSSPFLSVLSVLVGVTLYKNQTKRRLYAFAATMIGGGLLNVLLKLYYQRPRPSEFPPLVTAHGHSFPSGHSMGSMLFFGSLAYVLYISLERSRAWRLAAVVLCILAAMIIGASRIYLGVHYFSDVVAGFTAGLCWIGVCLSGTEAWARWRDWRRARREEGVREEKAGI